MTELGLESPRIVRWTRETPHGLVLIKLELSILASVSLLSVELVADIRDD